MTCPWSCGILHFPSPRSPFLILPKLSGRAANPSATHTVKPQLARQSLSPAHGPQEASCSNREGTVGARGSTLGLFLGPSARPEEFSTLLPGEQGWGPSSATTWLHLFRSRPAAARMALLPAPRCLVGRGGRPLYRRGGRPLPARAPPAPFQRALAFARCRPRPGHLLPWEPPLQTHGLGLLSRGLRLSSFPGKVWSLRCVPPARLRACALPPPQPFPPAQGSSGTRRDEHTLNLHSFTLSPPNPFSCFADTPLLSLWMLKQRVLEIFSRYEFLLCRIISLMDGAGPPQMVNNSPIFYLPFTLNLVTHFLLMPQSDTDTSPEPAESPGERHPESHIHLHGVREHTLWSVRNNAVTVTTGTT